MSAEPRSLERVLSIGIHERSRVGARHAGVARVAPALALVLVALLGLCVLAYLRVRAASASVEPDGVDAVDAVEPMSPTSLTSPRASSPNAIERSREASVEETNGRRPLADRGHVQGALTVPPGASFPERWELVVRPATAGDASGAESRTIAFEAGETEYDVRDLELGAYEVVALAEGMNGYAQQVALTAESPWVYVIVALAPAGDLSGRIVHEDGSGIASVVLRLVARGSGRVHEAKTDFAGVYRFERIPDGEYELFCGDPEHPLLEPRSISFTAPGMHLPPDIVEGVGAVTFEVVDRRGDPVEGVALTGSGTRGGTIDHVTDSTGHCEVAGLPSGRYRVWTVHEDFGRDLEVFELRSAGHPIVRFVLE